MADFLSCDVFRQITYHFRVLKNRATVRKKRNQVSSVIVINMAGYVRTCKLF